MRRLAVLATLFLSLFVLTPVSPAAAALPADQCSTQPYAGDPRLGPDTLASRGPVGWELLGYRRLAGRDPERFLGEFWDSGAGSWRYPPSDGYLIVGGEPVSFTLTLAPGQRIDRYGSEYGRFLAPQGTPYAMRSIPPQSLNTYDPAYTCNYHVYQVLKSFEVRSGPIAPAFGQPGLGSQYQLVGALLPGDPPAPNEFWLVDHGFLSRVN